MSISACWQSSRFLHLQVVSSCIIHDRTGKLTKSLHPPVRSLSVFAFPQNLNSNSFSSRYTVPALFNVYTNADSCCFICSQMVCFSVDCLSILILIFLWTLETSSQQIITESLSLGWRSRSVSTSHYVELMQFVSMLISFQNGIMLGRTFTVWFNPVIVIICISRHSCIRRGCIYWRV
jgi:hypothetical protein